MKIRKLHLKNIGVFDDEEIEFKECPAKDKAEIHILTGENGTGKTTILKAITSLFGKGFWDEGKVSNLIKRLRLVPLSEQTVNDKDPNNLFTPYDLKDFFNIVSGVFEDKTESAFAARLTEDKQLSRTFGLGLEYAKLIKENNQPLNFCVFVFSGYRQINEETVQANYLPKNFNPLSQSFKFIKDYRKEGEITINQLVANNISNRALSKEDGSLEEAKKYETVINSIETFIKDVTDYEVKFVLKRSPNELKLKMHGEELDFDVLPDGLRSLISWIADLLGRVDLLKWQDDLPITEKNLILLLDEIEVHLHPAWQRKVLPVVQKLFKNAQIFVSTHSPFVVNSVDDAWVYKLKVEDGKAKVESVTKSEDGNSYSYVLEETFDIKEEFGVEAEKELDEFYELRNSILSNGSGEKDIKKITKIAENIAKQSEELNTIIQIELRQINRKKGLNLKI